MHSDAVMFRVAMSMSGFVVKGKDGVGNRPLVQLSLAPAMFPLLAANALTASSLYWAQSVIGFAAAELKPSAFVALAPGATLLGYALGVAGLATFAHDISRPSGLARHGACLAAALCVAAASPNGACLALACLGIGAGCALTQRILVLATTIFPESQRAQAIGTIVASSLFGILCARAYVPEAAAVFGWRLSFLAAAVAFLIACMTAVWLTPRRNVLLAIRSDLPPPMVLLRNSAPLRAAALQQSIVFAAFNLGWSLFPSASHAPPTARALIATAGAFAAIMSGRACLRLAPSTVALVGLCTVGGAAVIAMLIYALRISSAGPLSYIAMSMLEIGTQVALVANQTRAQAAAPSVPVRGRMASIMTTIGFGGGAAGAAIGNLVWR